MLNKMFGSVKNLVAKSETAEAILSLMDLTKSNYRDYENDVILLSGKYHNYQKELVLDIIEDGQRVLNKINYSILQLISLIEYEEQIKFKSKRELVGYILVQYWSNKKWKDDYTINTAENENIQDLSEIINGEIYIVKYSYGANLRAYLPPKEGYSNRAINETQLIINLAQGTKVEVLEQLYEYSINDYWAKVKVVENK